MKVSGEIEVSNGKEDWTRQHEKIELTNVEEAEFMQFVEAARKLWPVVERWQWRSCDG